MNTVRSVGYGWAVLILAGGGSYYFAKRQINADREERAHAEEMRRQHREQLRAQEAIRRNSSLKGQGAKPSSRAPAANKDHPSPSQEKAMDPAPVMHSQDVATQQSQYEAVDPFRSRKGDRFS